MRKSSKENKVKSMIRQMAVKSAEKGANDACFLIAYQPKESEAVKRMRKF